MGAYAFLPDTFGCTVDLPPVIVTSVDAGVVSVDPRLVCVEPRGSWG